MQKDAADRLNSTLGVFFVYTSTPKHTCLSDVPLCRRTCALRRLGQQPAHCRAQLDEAYLRVSFHAHLPRTYSLSAQCTIRESTAPKPHFFFWQRLDEIFVGCDGTHDVPAMGVHGTVKPACRQACRQARQSQRVASTSERSSDSAAVCLLFLRLFLMLNVYLNHPPQPPQPAGFRLNRSAATNRFSSGIRERRPSSRSWRGLLATEQSK